MGNNRNGRGVVGVDKSGIFTLVKKILAFITGILVLYASIVFSKEGLEFNIGHEYAWVGWVLAFAVTSAQFILNSDFKKINFSILLVGAAAYVYSIYTNIVGFHALRPERPLLDIFNVSGGVFMDIYPEVAISWALGESKLGDLLGNLVKSYRNPGQLISNTQQVPTVKREVDPQIARKLPHNNGGRESFQPRQQKHSQPPPKPIPQYNPLDEPDEEFESDMQ